RRAGRIARGVSPFLAHLAPRGQHLTLAIGMEARCRHIGQVRTATHYIACNCRPSGPSILFDHGPEAAPAAHGILSTPTEVEQCKPFPFILSNPHPKSPSRPCRHCRASLA